MMPKNKHIIACRDRDRAAETVVCQGSHSGMLRELSLYPSIPGAAFVQAGQLGEGS